MKCSIYVVVFCVALIKKEKEKHWTIEPHSYQFMRHTCRILVVEAVVSGFILGCTRLQLFPLTYGGGKHMKPPDW